MISHRQGFYVSPTEPHANDLDAAAIQLLPHAYESPATVRGSAQLIPCSKFFGEGVAILNFHLQSLDVDAGDLGGLLKVFAAAFFGGTDKVWYARTLRNGTHAHCTDMGVWESGFPFW